MRKTIFTLGLMLAAALSLTNCTKNEEANFTPEVKVPFEFYANMDDTRTVNDGMVGTDWVAGDAINVFHAEATTDTYVPDGSFTTDDATGLFKGTLAGELTAAAYDWYAFYPYSSYIKTPANTSAGYMPVGCKSNQTQTQSGNDNMSHIAGDNYPLYGVAKSVAASEKPEITMKHLTSLLAFDVYDQTGEGFVVESIAFTAPEDIVGTYYINFAAEPVEYTGSGDNFVSSTATLTVENGEEVTGDGAMFYMGIKPFTAKTNSTLTVKITTNKGTFEKSITLTKDTTFAAGKFKTLTVNVDELEGNEPSGLTSTISFATTDQREDLNSTSQTWTNGEITLINNQANSTSNIANYSNPVRFYKDTSIDITSSVGNMTKIDFVCNSEKYATALQSSIEGSTASGNTITVTFAEPTNSFSFILDAQVRMNSLTVTYVPLDENTPYIGLSTTSVSAVAEATNVEIPWVLTNLAVEDITITSSADWVTFDAANDKLTIIIAENTAREVREATVTINAKEIEATISVKQLGIVTLDTVTIAQFLAADESTTAWYELTGVISNIAANNNFGNFDITDDTATVYVYGLTAEKTTSNDQSFPTLNLKEGDVVTLIGTRASYNGTAQVGGPAYYVSHKASCVSPTITCEENVVTITAEEGTTIYYTTNGDNPTTTSEVYSEPFTIEETCMIKAFAIADDKPKSVISEKTCVFVDPNAGNSKKTYTFTITKADFNGTSYAANNNEKTSTATAEDGSTIDVKWTSNQVMYQNNVIQWQKSKGYIYNSTDLGTITNVAIDRTDGTFTTYINSSAQPTANGVGGYFKISVGSATGKVNSITITFEK